MAGIPKRYRDAKPRDFDLEDFRPTELCISDVFLTGGTGIGKTHMAAALLKLAIQGHAENDLAKAYGDEPDMPADMAAKDPWWVHNQMWFRVPDLLMEIRRTYNQDSKESESELVCRFRRLPYLVMDDMGAEKASPWTISVMYSVLAGRIDDCMPTIVTSNLTLDDISERLDDRIASRLSAFAPIPLPEDDRRLNAG